MHPLIVEHLSRERRQRLLDEAARFRRGRSVERQPVPRIRPGRTRLLIGAVLRHRTS